MDLPPAPFGATERARVMDQLRRFTAHISPELSLVLQVEEAPDAPGEIGRQVARLGADLLVIGTHGRSLLSRLVLGSVAETAIRSARCPTLVVPPRAGHAAAGTAVQFRHLLCPIDFSEGSLDALAMALSLAEENDARLTLLHVVERPGLVGNEAALIIDLPTLEAESEAHARRSLGALIPESVRPYRTVDVAVRHGRVPDELLHVAAALGSDLIVMGAHGRGVIDRLLSGSTTGSVLRAAGCPVLIARPAHA